MLEIVAIAVAAIVAGVKGAMASQAAKYNALISVDQQQIQYHENEQLSFSSLLAQKNKEQDIIIGLVIVAVVLFVVLILIYA